MKSLIKNFTIDELKDLVHSTGFEKYRAEQIYHSIYKQRIDNFNLISNTPIEVRKYLSSNYILDSLRLKKVSLSRDGTKKYLFELVDGNKIETVLIPDTRKKLRLSLCVSSQVGCTLNCTFCATGKLPFKRNLWVAEIIDQVLMVEKIEKIKITNIVFMGMGEPLYNYDNVIKAIKILSNEKYLIVPQKKITISTVGVKDKIEELANSGLKVKLAISLHATTDSIRHKLIPYSKRMTISELMNSIEYYYRKTKRQITYEYIFLEGINNSIKDITRLAKICKRVPSKVNIIPYHDISFTNDKVVEQFKPANKESIDKFYHKLKQTNTNVFVRTSSGFDIDAACGQLAYSERFS